MISNHRLCVAPMMDCTDRYDRYFLRAISRHTVLYTEMLSTAALLHGDTHKLVRFHPAEHPVALQLGGSDPRALAQCAVIAEQCEFDEINLNVGCPSDRVQGGHFGACLMAEPDLVAECVMAMQASVRIPVTVKTRIGIDNRDSYEELRDFVGRVALGGPRTWIIHARKAWLSGLSPRENRELPPLRYDIVHRLRDDFPELSFVLNGGIRTLDQALENLTEVDGVMIGRAAYKDPYLLALADGRIFGDPHAVPTRHEIVLGLLDFIEAELDTGVPLIRMTRHLLGIFQGIPGAKAWRRFLSENAHRPGAGVDVVKAALDKVPEATATDFPG